MVERAAFEKIGHAIPFALLQRQLDILEFNAWGWPDTSNIDFQEIQSIGLQHVFDNRVPMNFFEAVLRAESL